MSRATKPFEEMTLEELEKLHTNPSFGVRFFRPTMHTVALVPMPKKWAKKLNVAIKDALALSETSDIIMVVNVAGDIFLTDDQKDKVVDTIMDHPFTKRLLPPMHDLYTVLTHSGNIVTIRIREADEFQELAEGVDLEKKDDSFESVGVGHTQELQHLQEKYTPGKSTSGGPKYF